MSANFSKDLKYEFHGSSSGVPCGLTDRRPWRRFHSFSESLSLGNMFERSKEWRNRRLRDTHAEHGGRWVRPGDFCLAGSIQLAYASEPRTKGSIFMTYHLICKPDKSPLFWFQWLQCTSLAAIVVCFAVLYLIFMSYLTLYRTVRVVQCLDHKISYRSNEAALKVWSVCAVCDVFIVIGALAVWHSSSVRFREHLTYLKHSGYYMYHLINIRNSWARWMHSITLHPISVRPIVIVSSHLCLRM